MRILVVGLLIVPLAGCGVANTISAQSDYKQSAAAYKTCLAANPSAPQSCESQRLAMETDDRTLNNVSVYSAHSSSSIALQNR